MGGFGFAPQAEIGNDWLVLSMILGLLLPMLWIRQDSKSYRIFLKRVLSFKAPGKELSMAGYSLLGNIVAAVSFSLSSASIIYTLVPVFADNAMHPEMGRQLNLLLRLALFSAIYLLVRMLLYSVLNPFVYRMMRFSRDQYRWPVFCQMVYLLLSQVLSVMSVSVLFLSVPPLIAAIVLAVFLVLVKIEVFITLYDTLFGRKGYYFIFFSYLCGVEIAPVILGYFALTRIVLIF